jgi:2',3'-cyclic-nucleotide 2'-phosphodiesterase (5'-nucleotidase family)
MAPSLERNDSLVDDRAEIVSDEQSFRRVGDIQSAAHRSPLLGEVAQTVGIVTGVAFNGFYLQDLGDGDDATADGIFVFTGEQPTVRVGDETQALGTVSEFIPGGASSGNLSVTQLSSSEVVVLSTGNPLPAAVVIGQSGRIAPDEIVISDDELSVNLQSSPGNFDPQADAIDFYESLEGMRVSVEDAIAISPTQVFGEFSAEAFTLPNRGATASPDGILTARGGINLRSGPDNTGDQNPERVQIQFDSNLLPEGFETPALTVGDRLGNVTGVVGYSFGNFEVNVTDPFTVTPSGLQPETTPLMGSEKDLTVASYNVLNLSALAEDDLQRKRLAEQIVKNLNAPDILGLQEIQDNDGETDGTQSAVTDASETLQKLVDAIVLAGGPIYAFADIAPENNTTGGAPGSNIRNSFLYNPDRVSLDSLTLLSDSEAFEGSRKPLIGEFRFNGKPVTIINNHFSSRFGSTPVFGGPQPFIQATEAEREAQAQAINDYVDGRLSAAPNANIVALGDFNTFEFTDDLTEILPGVGDEKVLTNLVAQAVEDGDAYSFIFEGNSQVLDNLFVSDALLTEAKFDMVHVNNDFPRDDNRLRFEDTVVASDHEPIVAQLTLKEDSSMTPFTLQLLHLSDQEAGIPALEDAPRASAVLNALKDDYENTLTLSSGDAIIPGVFFSSSEEAYGGAGRADILIQNELGIQAISFGNHEFDLGTELVRDLVAGGEDDLETLDIDESFIGAQFPYLSSNLDFSTDENLADLVVPDDQAPQANSIAASTIVDVNGQKIGIVGATTPTLGSISSPGDVTINPQPFEGTPTAEQLDALAAEIQTDVDELLAANLDLNKVVLLAHMQQIGIEQELSTRLTNVDIIVAGGSNTRLLDETDRLRAGDTTQGPYPIFETDAEGNPIAIVNTDGNYKYIGRLVVDFDENGNVIPESYDPEVSGAYATDEQGVADLNAEALVDPEVQEIVNRLNEVIVAKESNVFGISNVFLNGSRGSVRTEETNLGNLTADANLAIAKTIDPTTVISIKNGGGIRDNIGRSVVPPGGTGEPEQLPTEEIPGVKPAGGISENDIANSLRFNNGLSLLTISAEELLGVLEYGVAETSTDDSVSPGRFPQVSGIEFSFDPTAEPNNRIESLVILDEAGNDADVVVQNGEIVGDPARTFRLVTLGFLAEGGDGYTFPARDVVNITQPEEAVRTGVATFAADGSEQDALAEYLAAFDADSPFDGVDTARAEDTRIQNLTFRADSVIDDASGGGSSSIENFLIGTAGEGPFRIGDGNDFVAGTLGDDTIFGDGGSDILKGELEGIEGGNDAIFGGTGNDLLLGETGNDLLLGEAGDDLLFGGAGEDFLRGGLGNDTHTGGADKDIFSIALGEGTDSLLDFELGSDFIGLSEELSLGQLYVVQDAQNAVVGSSETGEVLAVLVNIVADQLGQGSFLSV